jgi:putative solute:sodium symporter small subunit
MEPPGFAENEAPTEAVRRVAREDTRRRYWTRNLRYVAILLVIWFVVSYGFGILLVEPLNRIRVGGFQLGVWFAQQGSIYVFVILIFVYVALMNRLDRDFDVDERDAGAV